MDKEQILSTLKEKLGSTQFSEKSLNTYVDNNLPSEGVEPDEAFWTRHVNILKSFQGQYSNDVATQINNQLQSKVAEHLAKHPETIQEYISKHPELLTPPNPEPNKGGDDEKFKTLNDEIAALREILTKQTKEQRESGLRQSVFELAKQQSLEVNQALWEDAVAGASIAETTTAEELFNAAKTLYSDKYKRVFGSGAKPFETQSFVPNLDGNKTVNQFFAEKAKKEGWAK